MQPTICSRCKKNIAVIFVTRMDKDGPIDEGLCFKCAKELNIRHVDDIMKKLGISDEDLDQVSSDMLEAFGGPEALETIEDAGEDENGKTATVPFLNKLFGGPMNRAQGPNPGPAPERPGQQGREKEGQPRGQKKKFLENYCICLTDKARNGELDRIVGKTAEIERVIQVLNRRQKNNPCLIGEPGVGKTAIAEGLAQRIADRRVPFKLRDKEVYLLDLTALVAGTQFRGQFESRMKGLIEEIKRLGNIILVIDEVHNIVGAGDAEGSMNAANILKPALSRGEIQVVGATTFAEYRKHIEKDAALERRFQPVIVNEPSISESIEIIRGISHYYEKFHNVRIPPEMARQAVLLSERYVTDRYLPDKAIDLIDEACSNVSLHSEELNRMEELRKEKDDLARERDLLLTKQEEEETYERLAEIRSRDMQISEQLTVLEASGIPELTLDNLAQVIEQWTKIPASSICEDEQKRLSELDKRLKAHIIGQDEAVDAVCAAIKRGRAGVTAKRKPVSFIFVGSTGVGKTELVKRLAADLFDTPESLIRLDMSEFMEKHAVSRIIGSPPGYVGYDEAGQLTEKIRRKPYSV
ncbi:MAG: ATP-dependent Clp protease ATP-binding subunit, partial [Oscillospiraceae bacterium]|nr:ATP-dependent Clp protease ATP-binding subunit [Oscillospiraceae bacterium]